MTAGNGNGRRLTVIDPLRARVEITGAPTRDPDRLFPTDRPTRDIARGLYERVATAPIVSPHGHVPVEWIAHDAPFADPMALLVTHDHYVTRLLHASGVDLADLGVGGHPIDPREAWRIFAENWRVFAGTSMGYWLEEELHSVLGIDLEPSAETADALYDGIQAKLDTPQFRPRALFEQFGIDVLATTDDPLDDLHLHAEIAASGLAGRVLPTFRPDRYLDPDAPGFPADLERLLDRDGQPTTFRGYLDALRARRSHFIRHGATSADHGVEDPQTVDMSDDEAESLFQAVVSGRANARGRRAFRGHMLLQMARMSVEDGLVMTLHAGVVRNHSTATFERFGPDTGHDFPRRTDFVRGLRPLLERFGLERSFHLVLFAVDETVYSREIAPMASFYPCVYVGAPWWFLDAPDAMARFRSAVTESAGFSRGSGFIDDTRAFLSIPARHDTARRADASFLARLVREGRLTEAAAGSILEDIVGPQPKRVFKL
ncbi:glucuronate isomerase [Microbacterium trichothecenolyticum]|uniref:glucuronate isomerase n=1 Tax=Microbacterium trichothecenolyticum TaxID=69370 RepID=UPI001C6F5786|nr:glucuronate isomerase [Microbacterium trichothecenolyticum]MBW9120465.1 glucuronate isomerase [Microbacterium trichothecenolyticum]